MSQDALISPSQPWCAVKCLFSHPSGAHAEDHFFYEERITLWQVSSFDEAFALAEAEAAAYARSNTCTFIRATDSFHLSDREVGHGSEVWSVMRRSGMEPESYAQNAGDTPVGGGRVLEAESPAQGSAA
jgi:hypothetical protein